MHFLAKSHLVFLFCCVYWRVVLVLILHEATVRLAFSIFYLSFNKASQGCGYCQIYFWSRVINEVLMESWKQG